MFAEVNAEVCHFLEDETSHWGFKRIRVNNYQYLPVTRIRKDEDDNTCFYSVGRQILTKRAGADDDVADTDMEDITGLYKNPEGLARHQQQKQGDGCFNSLFSKQEQSKRKKIIE